MMFFFVLFLPFQVQIKYIKLNDYNPFLIVNLYLVSLISQQSSITLSKTAELLDDPNYILKDVYEGAQWPNRHAFKTASLPICGNHD